MNKIVFFITVILFIFYSCNSAREEKIDVVDTDLNKSEDTFKPKVYAPNVEKIEKVNSGNDIIKPLPIPSANKKVKSNNGGIPDYIKMETKQKSKGDYDILPPPPPPPTTQPSANNKKKSGVLGYSYFKKMRQEETRNIYVQVLAVNTGNVVSRLMDSIIVDLKDINTQIKSERKSDTASYFTTNNIYFYKYLTITLSDPNNNFIIDSLNVPSKQFIDTTDSNKWKWAVTPKSSVKNSRLFINVVAEREDGSQKPIDTREIAIDIQLETNFWRTLITWLRNNPDKLLVLILIPLVGYIVTKLFDYFKLKRKSI